MVPNALDQSNGAILERFRHHYQANYVIGVRRRQPRLDIPAPLGFLVCRGCGEPGPQIQMHAVEGMDDHRPVLLGIEPREKFQQRLDSGIDVIVPQGVEPHDRLLHKIEKAS